MAMPANYINARVIYSSPQKPFAINVLWFELADAPSDPGPNADDFCTILGNAIGPFAEACLTPNCAFAGVACSLVTGGSTFNAYNTDGAHLGVVLGDELPSYAAVLIQKRTYFPGRQGRGRWFIPFVPETMTDESRVIDASLPTYQLLAEAYAANYTVGGTVAAPMHYSPFDDALVPIAFVQAMPVLATQRRRRLRQTY